MTMGPDYGSPSYWDERYSGDEATYDWYMDYHTLQPHLTPFIGGEREFEILIVGCGNSTLGAELYDEGFVNITNIDSSQVVINHMSHLYASKEEMEYTVMDARKLEYVPDQCFDLVIDKALLDALFCSETNTRDVEDYLCEMMRVLKPDGIFFVISHAGPTRRLPYLQKLFGQTMDIHVDSIEKPPVPGVAEDGDLKNHFLYICKKLVH